jgi:hypothetical protein
MIMSTRRASMERASMEVNMDQEMHTKKKEVGVNHGSNRKKEILYTHQ